MTPYRLLNSVELRQLTDFFQQKIHDWNEEYCLHPFTFELTLAPVNHRCINPLLIDNLVLLEDDYIGLINEALFGMELAVFVSTAQELFLRFITSLFHEDAEALNFDGSQNPDWFYKGSTCLSLTLRVHEKTCTLFLNPDWIYAQLPAYQNSGTPLNPLHEALDQQQVILNLELSPSTLSVKHLANIQIGDVLSTNHHVSASLNLTRNQQLITHARLGINAQHKSIVLQEKL